MSEPVDINVAASDHHVFPIKTYLGVFAALLVLTVITVAVSYMDLGPASLYVALLVAFIKAAFVVGFFMHLRYDSTFHQLLFFSSGVFILIMFGFTFIDLSSRKEVVVEHGTFELRREQADARRAAEFAKRMKAAQEASSAQASADETGSAGNAAEPPAAAPPAADETRSAGNAAEPPAAAPPAADETGSAGSAAEPPAAAPPAADETGSAGSAASPGVE
jgi:cytochrome c oxidase subunit 4